MEVQVFELISKLIPEHCRLTRSCLVHMSGILVEDPPQNVHDVKEVLGDYFRMAHMPTDGIPNLCSQIYQALQAGGILKKENKHSLMAA